MLAGREPDYMASVLFHGLAAVVGAEGVSEPCPSTHRTLGDSMNAACNSMAAGATQSWNGVGGNIDLFVIHNSHLRDTNGSWELALATRKALPESCLVALINGDDHTGPYPEPPFPVDFRFQRELLVDDYSAEPLLLAAPAGWVRCDKERVFDVCFLGAVDNEPRRQVAAMLAEQAGHGMKMFLGSGRLPWPQYMEVLRSSRIAVCPPGAGADTMRMWEALSAGCVVVPTAMPHRRWPPGTIALRHCDIGELAWFLDAVHSGAYVIAPEEHQRTIDMFLKYHTTQARARQFLAHCGFIIE